MRRPCLFPIGRALEFILRRDRLQSSPQAISRAFGVSAAADINRTYRLERAGFRVEWSTIPSAITPLNRVIVGIPPAFRGPHQQESASALLREGGGEKSSGAHAGAGLGAGQQQGGSSVVETALSELLGQLGALGECRI